VNVEVVSGETLRAQFEPDTKGVGNLLYAVAWSDNGESLYAGGMFVKDGTYLIRRWPLQGKGKPIDIRAAPDAIADILPLPHSELVFGSGDPGWGVIDSGDKPVRYVGPASAGVLHWSKLAVFSVPAMPSAFCRLDGKFYVGLANRGYDPATYDEHKARRYAYADKASGSIWLVGR
jgi:hypothetical protein